MANKFRTNTLTLGGKDITTSGNNAYINGVILSNNTGCISFYMDGGGLALTTGIKGYIEVPFNCTINKSTLLADQTGLICLNIYKNSYINFPPTNSITANALPTITSGIKAQDSTLTNWITNISGGDILGYSLISGFNITRLTSSLTITKV